MLEDCENSRHNRQTNRVPREGLTGVPSSRERMLRRQACRDRPTTTALPRRDRLVAAIIVEAALGLAAEPAGLDIFHQKRARPVLGVRQTLMQDLHDREASI